MDRLANTNNSTDNVVRKQLSVAKIIRFIGKWSALCYFDSSDYFQQMSFYSDRQFQMHVLAVAVTGPSATDCQPNRNKPFQRFSFRYRLTHTDRHYQFRMRRAHGLFLSQPITTLDNISYIFLAQSALKTQVYMENYNLLQHNKLALWRNKSSASWFSTVKLRKTKHIDVHVTPCPTRYFKPLPQFRGIPLAHFQFFSGMTRGIDRPDPVRMRTRNAETAYCDIEDRYKCSVSLRSK